MKDTWLNLYISHTLTFRPLLPPASRTVAKISFLNLKNSFASNVTTLRRRLSSENVSSPYDDRLDSVDPDCSVLPGPSRTRYRSGDKSAATPTTPSTAARLDSRTTSAPTSPLKERVSKRDTLLGKVSVFSQVGIVEIMHSDNWYMYYILLHNTTMWMCLTLPLLRK